MQPHFISRANKLILFEKEQLVFWLTLIKMEKKINEKHYVKVLHIRKNTDQKNSKYGHFSCSEKWPWDPVHFATTNILLIMWKKIFDS